jgi:hypothetical protein
MSGLFTHLVARTLGIGPSLAPLLPTGYESWSEPEPDAPGPAADRPRAHDTGPAEELHDEGDRARSRSRSSLAWMESLAEPPNPRQEGAAEPAPPVVGGGVPDAAAPAPTASPTEGVRALEPVPAAGVERALEDSGRPERPLPIPSTTPMRAADKRGPRQTSGASPAMLAPPMAKPIPAGRSETPEGKRQQEGRPSSPVRPGSGNAATDALRKEAPGSAAGGLARRPTDPARTDAEAIRPARPSLAVPRTPLKVIADDAESPPRTPASAPEVQITIGVVEVRAPPQPAPSPPQRHVERPRPVALADYLAQRGGTGR